MTKPGNAQRASDICGELLEAVYRWDAEVDAFMQTGDDDAEVVVTHDGRGRLIELSIRPGLQEELTTEELEDAINDEIAQNAQRGYEGLNAIANKFLARFANIPDDVARHPVATQFATALRNAQ